MKRCVSLLLFFLTLSQISLFAEERIGGTLSNVDLLIEDIYNDDNHNFGEKYLAINRGNASMRVSIQLTESENVEDHLIDHTVIVGPKRRVDLGYIIQKDPSRGASWKYEWKAQRDND